MTFVPLCTVRTCFYRISASLWILYGLSPLRGLRGLHSISTERECIVFWSTSAVPKRGKRAMLMAWTWTARQTGEGEEGKEMLHWAPMRTKAKLLPLGAQISHSTISLNPKENITMQRRNNGNCKDEYQLAIFGNPSSRSKQAGTIWLHVLEPMYNACQLYQLCSLAYGSNETLSIWNSRRW